jgi:hypothetical protein
LFICAAALAAITSLSTSISEPVTVTSLPTPISGPVTITTSGNYIVTKDFNAGAVPAFKLVGNVVADIDFAGHTVSGTIPLLDDGTSTCNRTIKLHDGTYSAGFIDAHTFRLHCRNEVFIDHMILTGTYLTLEDAKLSVTSSVIINASTFVDANWGLPPPEFENNEVYGGSFIGSGASGASIVGNTFHSGSITLKSDVDGWNLGNVTVRGNVLRNGNITINDDFAFGAASGHDIQRNRVSGVIVLGESFDSTVRENTIGCAHGGTAVSLKGYTRRNRITNNTFAATCDHGMSFSNLSFENRYGGNLFEEIVPEPIIDEGEGNSSIGGVLAN